MSLLAKSKVIEPTVASTGEVLSVCAEHDKWHPILIDLQYLIHCSSMSWQIIHKDISILIRYCAQLTTLTLSCFSCDTPILLLLSMAGQLCIPLPCSYHNLSCWDWSMAVATWKMERTTAVLTARMDFTGSQSVQSQIDRQCWRLVKADDLLHPFLISPHPPLFLSLWWTVMCLDWVQCLNITNGGNHYNHQQSSILHGVVFWN